MKERQEQRIATLSVVAGTPECNARCPFCVSKMTPTRGMQSRTPEIVWERFDKAFEYAKAGQAEAVMITGKGEPTLFPEHITGYLKRFQENEERTGFNIQCKQLQTNGIRFEQKAAIFDPMLVEWKRLGLETIAVSVVHYEAEENRKIYVPYLSSYINLSSLIDRLHGFGLRTRLACVMVNGLIDSPQMVQEMMDFARENNVEELTFRPVNKPENSLNNDVHNWVVNHHLQPDQVSLIHEFLASKGQKIKEFSWGGVIYDIGGQNVCLTNSLTHDDKESLARRQLIFYPNGIIATDWTQDAEVLP